MCLTSSELFAKDNNCVFIVHCPFLCSVCLSVHTLYVFYVSTRVVNEYIESDLMGYIRVGHFAGQMLALPVIQSAATKQ